MTERSALAAALAVGGLAWAAPASAETAPGYILNPPGGDTTRQLDPDGMSHLRDTRRRTPTGFLYPEPLEPQVLSALGDGWLGRGSLEIGGMTTFGDDQETRFSTYADWSREFLLDSFAVGVSRPEQGLSLDARGGAVGRSDDYYSGEVRWLSQLRLRGSWSGIPHTYATDARNLFRGAGSEELTLPPPLEPGNNTDEGVAATLAAIDESRLSVQRDELGLHVEARPLSALRLFAGYERTARDGERPFGGSLVYATGLTRAPGRSVETTQPLDDVTHEVSAGVEYGHSEMLGRLSYQGSFYRNHDDELTWDNPFIVSPVGRGSQNVRRGRFALAPDNSWNNAKGEFMARIPLDGVFTTTVSWSTLHQDDDLLPPTVNSGTVGQGPSLVNLDLWNGSAALARGGADASATTLLVNGDLRLRPWRKVRLGARVRYYDRNDKTRYTAQNPLTGEIGYVAEDGALAVGTPFSRVFRPGQTNPPSDDWRYASTPYSFDQLVAEGSADYALRPKTSLALRYSWQRLGYDHRERERTDESRVRIDLKSRELAFATARLSYAFAKRTGTSYDPDPYRDYYVSSLPGFTPLNPLAPFTLPGLRKYDLSDRSRQVADLKLNFLVREDMDLALVARYRGDDFDAEYGLRGDRRATASLEWALQPSPLWGASLFGTFERGWRRMKTVNDAGADFPPENTWSARSRESTVAAGLNAWRRLFERVTLETNYTFILTRSRVDYDYASDGALSLGITAGTAGSRFPTLTTEDHVLVTSLRLELARHLALRVFHLYRRGRIEDFQQAGLEAGVLGGAYYLGHVDRDFHAHALGATVELRF